MRKIFMRGPHRNSVYGKKIIVQHHKKFLFASKNSLDLILISCGMKNTQKVENYERFVEISYNYT